MPVSDEDLNGILEVDAVFCYMPVTFMKMIVFAFVRPWLGRCLSGEANTSLLKFRVREVGQDLLARDIERSIILEATRRALVVSGLPGLFLHFLLSSPTGC